MHRAGLWGSADPSILGRREMEAQPGHGDLNLKDRQVRRT